MLNTRVTRCWPGVLVGLVAGAVSAPMVAAADRTDRDQRYGWHECAHATTACEGTLRVPLDWDDPSGEKIEVGFTFVPREDRSRPATGTVMANPGGPGPVVGQLPSLRLVFGPVLRRQNLLLIDPRGLGRSSPLRCEGFDARVPAKVRDCTARLGDGLRYFAADQAVTDFDAVRRAVGVPKVTWWGHSYGTVFATAYATRFPESVTALYLNGTKGLRGDGYAAGSLTSALHDESLRVLDSICAASSACRALPGDAREQLSRLTRSLRAHPDPQVSWAQLSQLVTASGDSVTGRELSAAVAGHLAGDKAPLRRLATQYAKVEDQVEQYAKDPAYPGRLTYICNDAVYPFARHASVAEKRRQYRAYNARHLVEPFRPEEVLTGANGDEVCPDWPTPRESPPVPPGAQYPDVPVLVVNGANDATTPPHGAAETARRFPRATFVTVPHGVHGHGWGGLGPYSDCVVEAMRTFVERPRHPVRHPRCDGESHRALGGFPRTADAAGDRVHAEGLTPAQRRIIGVAYATTADAIARRDPTNRITFREPRQQGLRGGTVHFDDQAEQITFDGVRYVSDTAVDGRASFADLARATVTVTGGDGRRHQVRLSWKAYGAAETISLTGAVDGRSFTARTSIG
ncbi:alpha/beta fold hydrolase [Nonomuraea sp. K274]|uniref:Alpha/beta fold hydrolase n=1 Tax=Nonomuraea cypriaca TaxID=1187855 RepID=A0A931A9X8_9ACTN|nr:alpha/beta fold hydrolase [Nonomuraea cypriaca]MBF8187948.1 alpha/beta fold hydrolase [Nonomuraea cypriaca]